MLAEKDDVFEETCETIFNLNQDDVARYWCQAREDGERIIRTYKSLMKADKKALAEKDALIAEKDSAIAEKDSAIAEKDSTINEMSSTIAMLQAKLAEYEK